MYQRTALVLSFYWHRMAKRRLEPISWVVGPDEVASMLFQIARVIPGSYSVSFTEEPAYAIAYSHRFRTDMSRRWLERLIVGPVLLGKLMNQAQGFIYVGHTGFLDDTDHREFEFRFLRKHGVPIVCYWTGSDIRSTRLMRQLEVSMGRPNVSTYISAKGEVFESQAWDDERRAIAEVADRYAVAMFNWITDQRAYLKTPCETFMYFLPDEPAPDYEKFRNVDRAVVVHATTSPVIKGTPLVRAAVDRLRSEGYDFEYVELIGVSNQRVKDELNRAHVVLNQFYGFTPTIFGIEALLRRCVVLMSSERAVEPDLAEGADDAWVVTPHSDVYHNLRRVLDSVEEMEEVADRGREWARAHATVESAGPRLRAVLDRILEGTYSPPKEQPWLAAFPLDD